MNTNLHRLCLGLLPVLLGASVFHAQAAMPSIAAGWDHSLFLKADGSVWATGWNASGQLGDGTRTGRDSSVQVLTEGMAIAAGCYHSLFLKTDGSVWATGINNYGQLGDGTYVQRNTPVRVMTGVKAIAAGHDHSLFLKTDGSVWATGYNPYGELGDGTTTGRCTPEQVTSLEPESALNFELAVRAMLSMARRKPQMDESEFDRLAKEEQAMRDNMRQQGRQFSASERLTRNELHDRHAFR